LKAWKDRRSAGMFGSEKVLEKLHVFGIDKFCFIAQSIPFALCVKMMPLLTLPYGVNDEFTLFWLVTIPSG